MYVDLLLWICCSLLERQLEAYFIEVNRICVTQVGHVLPKALGHLVQTRFCLHYFFYSKLFGVSNVKELHISNSARINRRHKGLDFS
jgi:hypothetical protein